MSETLLYVEVQPSDNEEQKAEAFAGADGLAIDPGAFGTEELRRLPSPVRVVRTDDPQDFGAWREQKPLAWASDAGLEHAARLQDAWPELSWVPRLAAFKPAVRYRLSDTFPGEGFRVYMPDTAAIREYQVIGGEATLSESLARAATLGFQTLWLHALDAEKKCSGLDLELLERTRSQFQGSLWLSGGAASERHLANLAAQDGATAVVVPATLATRCSCERLRRALATPPTTGLPLRFMAKTDCIAKSRG